MATTGSFHSLANSETRFSVLYTFCAASTPQMNAIWKVLNSSFGRSSIHVYPQSFRTEAKLDTGRYDFNSFGAGVFSTRQALTSVHSSGMSSSLSILVKSSARDFSATPGSAVHTSAVTPSHEDVPGFHFLITLRKV